MRVNRSARERSGKRFEQSYGLDATLYKNIIIIIIIQYLYFTVYF